MRIRGSYGQIYGLVGLGDLEESIGAFGLGDRAVAEPLGHLVQAEAVVLQQAAAAAIHSRSNS